MSARMQPGVFDLGEVRCRGKTYVIVVGYHADTGEPIRVGLYEWNERTFWRIGLGLRLRGVLAQEAATLITMRVTNVFYMLKNRGFNKHGLLFSVVWTGELPDPQ